MTAMSFSLFAVEMNFCCCVFLLGLRFGQVPARCARPGTGEGVPGCAEREEASPRASHHARDDLLIDLREVLLLIAQIGLPGLFVPDLRGASVSDEDHVAVEAGVLAKG